MTNIPLFAGSIIITITSECLLSSRLRGRVPWRDFQGQCRAEHERDRVKANGDVCGRRGEGGGERTGSRQPLRGERQSSSALPLRDAVEDTRHHHGRSLHK